MNLTYRYRIKDKTSAKHLSKIAKGVNLVWNHCNEFIKKRWKESRKYTNEKELRPLLNGASKVLDCNISSQTVQEVAKELINNYKSAKKLIRFRGRKHLGWIPLTNQNLAFINEEYTTFKLGGCKKYFKIWKDREIPSCGKIKSGCIAQDSKNHWFLNLVIELPDDYFEQANNEEVGIDLGLKSQLTLSDGEIFSHENITKKYEKQLTKAQRAKKKKQITKINAKIKNTRKDWNHKTTTKISSIYKNVFVGNIQPTQIIKVNKNISKSVYDASWFQLKTFLSYKVVARQGNFRETSERFSTVTCSSCFKKTGPSGLSGLGVREWVCSCGASHNRDVNAAINILRIGHDTPNKGVLFKRKMSGV